MKPVSKARKQPNPADFLAASQIINFDHPSVKRKARELAGAEPATDEAVAERCFLFVRDEIRHSLDYAQNPVTLKASEVLEHRTGFCYAKSHLLCALLRANGIPAGLCYQRLSDDNPSRPYCLHGFNAVYLPDHGWYRIDPRGNKPGTDARFSPPDEILAFTPQKPGEADLPGIFPDPLPEVVDVLVRCRDFREVAGNLPDLPVE